MDFLRYVPKSYLSWLVGSLVHLRLPPPLSTLSVRLFSNLYKIDPTLAEHPIHHYRSIGAFFIRDLKPEVRPIGEGIVCPVDGALRSCDDVPVSGELVQTKGKSYGLDQLLAGDDLAPRFAHGQVWNFYLSPTDAHHIFSPVSGDIVKSVHIPGSLWPVNDWALNTIDGLFACNERVVSYIESELGLIAVVMVGATNVGRIRLAYTDLETNLAPWKRKQREAISHEPKLGVKRGDKLGTFLMGSSVVLLTERKLSPVRRFESPRKVTYGVPLADLVS